jgi:hypothetical protein
MSKLKSDSVVNSDAIKEFLYHNLTDVQLKNLDTMFKSLEGQNFSKFDDNSVDLCFAEINLKGSISSKTPSNLRSVRLKNPNISLLLPYH